MLWWGLSTFHAHPEIDHIVIVGHEDDLPRLKELSRRFSKVSAVVKGGDARWESVRHGLDAIPPNDEWVLVHDAARAAVSRELITRVLRGTQETGAAIPALRIADTVKWVDTHAQVQCTVPREQRQDGDKWQLMQVQTPQGFHVSILRSAYERFDFREGVPTDDAMLVETFHPVTVVPGDPYNIKLTYPEDLARMEVILLGETETRTGFGYDVHPFAEGRRLVLGGVELPSPRGLAGHSDADVVLHAITDALLGAAGMNDIGTMFPNTDPSYRNADSTQLLVTAWKQVQSQGWRVVNVDVTILAEMPRLGPYISTMREHIASALQVAYERVNVKATTNERMGFIGREEGIACYAVAMLRRLPAE